MSAKFMELCKVMGIRHVPTTAYSRWREEPTESINEDLIQNISVYTKEKSKTWDDYVTSFFILFGQAASFPTDNIFQQPMELSGDSQEELRSYLQKREEQYNYIKDILERNIENRQGQNRQQYDKSQFEPALKPGELVLMREANPEKL